MFHNVNGDNRADCQENPEMFEKMRHAQFLAWSDEVLSSYLDDVKKAQAENRSLVREKYIWMMENTDPQGFDYFKKDLPIISDEKKELVARIWDILLVQTEKIREKYPVLALGGRPLHTSEEKNWPSVETYQKGELLTFSEKTLKLLLAHIIELQENGIDYAFDVQRNSVTCLGYKTMEEAELAMAAQFVNDMGITISDNCPTCNMPE